METKKENAGKLGNWNNETNYLREEMNDEELNLDELLEVQGGMEDNPNSATCGLGCFTGAMPSQSTNSHNRDGE